MPRASIYSPSLLLAAGLLLAMPAAASISGVCPDGSMFIVQRPESIPCRKAKLVDPDQMPPMRPDRLPRPYTWEVFQRKQDPNNPYNLIDAARAVRGESAGAGRQEASIPRESPPEARAAVSAPPTRGERPSAPPAPGPPDLALAEQDVRDLLLLVELSQERTPANFRAEDGGVVVGFARSLAFENRLRESLQARGASAAGPVLLFAVGAVPAESFYANLTFVQRHVAFHPDTGNPEQFGLIRGRLGPVAEPVLGYVVLPEYVDLTRSLDIYWNDRRVTATLTP